VRSYLRQGALDVYQPDVAWSTGIVGALAIAREVQSAGLSYTPHTWGDGLVVLANLHVSAAVGAAPWVEFPYDPPAWTPARRDFMLPTPVLARDGFATLPESAGLGVQIDWAALEEWRVR
jgi:L-alanine-DL-glutamate epimerase-like enolase superfamily enzyme